MKLSEIDSEFNDIYDELINLERNDDFEKLTNLKNRIIECKKNMITYKATINIDSNGNIIDISDKIKKKYLISNITVVMDWSNLMSKYLNNKFDAMVYRSDPNLKLIKKSKVNINPSFNSDEIICKNGTRFVSDGDNKCEVLFDDDSYLCYLAMEYDNKNILVINDDKLTVYIDNDYYEQPTIWKKFTNINQVLKNIFD